MLLRRILRESACQSSEEARRSGAGGAGGALAARVSAGGGRALPKLPGRGRDGPLFFSLEQRLLILILVFPR